MKKQLMQPGHLALGALSASVMLLASASIAGFDTVGTVQRYLHPTEAAGLPAHEVVEASRTAESVASLFDTRGYWLGLVDVTGLAPRIYVASLPKDLDAMRDIDARKRLFMRIMLPLVLSNNERIAEDRERLIEVRDRLAGGGRLTVGERLWLDRLATRHKASAEDVEALDDLIERVDVVPPSLALAQAIEESGWGTSSFAVANNSLFGQRVYDPLPPELARGRPDPDYRLAHYKTLGDSVAAYMRNVNSHRAYAEFRERRARIRAAGKRLGGDALAATLTRYSELGAGYVQKIQTLIRSNELTRFDDVTLGPSQSAKVVIPDA